MNVGKLNKRVTLSIPSEYTADGFGGFTPSTATQRVTWCSVAQLSAKEIISYGMNRNEIALRLTFRYNSAIEINYATTFTIDGKIYNLSSIDQTDELRQIIQVIVNGRR